MKNVFYAFPLLITLLFSLPSHAQRGGGFGSNIKFNISVLKYDTKVDGPNLGISESELSIYDIKLGYHSDSYYFGLIYNNRNIGDDKRTGTGVTLGYHSSGYFIDASYFLNATRDRVTTVLEKGSGVGLDLGYNMGLNSSLYIGVQASYKSFSYTERDGALEDNKEVSELYPMLNIGLVF